MSKIRTFGNTCDTWSSDCNLWSECLSDVIEIIGGARNPQEWGDHPFDLYENELKKYLIENPIKHDRLIEIHTKCEGKTSEKLARVSEDISITVDGVKFILETLNNVGIDIKNIKNYTDDDIKTLLL